MTKRIASCSCGQLAATTTEDPIRVSVCHCGATVHYAMEGQEEIIAIPVGAFAEPGFPAPMVSVYEERKHSWVAMPENIEHVA